MEVPAINILPLTLPTINTLLTISRRTMVVEEAGMDTNILVKGESATLCLLEVLLILFRSPMHGYSPNHSPYNQNQNYSPGYPGSQSYPQGGYQNGPYRGGRGNHYNGPDRRMSGPGGNFAPHNGRGRGVAPTQFSNLSWTPASGTRGGRPATEAPRPNPPASQAPAEAVSVDADDNPFRPSKDLRVEDEGPKEDKKMPPPTKPAVTPTKPKSGFGFSLKTKNPVPVASKAKSEEPEKVEPKSKESLLEPKKDAASRDSQYPSDTRNDRDRDYKYDRERDREWDRDYRERDRRYDYHDRQSAYRDPRDRDPRDLRDPRDPRDPYFRERERDYRDPRDRDLRDPRDIRDVRDRDPRDPRDLRDPRDPRDLRDPRDVRDRREPYPPRRSDDRRPEPRIENRHDNRPDRRPPPPAVPKTVMVKRKRIKARPTLTPEFAASESVYYRKPGNESVVGSGTYGKVFKGVHVYTKDEVALKKIRMEGERDGVSVHLDPLRNNILTA